MNSPASITVLYQRHAYLVGELARVNGELGDLASRKAQIEQRLESDTSLLCVKKRRLKQDNFLANKSLQKTEHEQAILYENMRITEAEMLAWQVAENDRLTAAQYHQYDLSWTLPHMQYYPSSADPQSTTIVDLANVARNSEPQWPPNWDHAMMQLDEASLAQDFTYPHETLTLETEMAASAPGRPDSGFEGPPLYMMPFDMPNYDASQHVYSHEGFYRPEFSNSSVPPPQPGTVAPNQIFPPPVSAMPNLLDEEMVSPRTTIHPQSDPHSTTAGETAEPKRRYSEAAVQLIEGRLNSKSHSRTKSSGGLAAVK
ncbi:MAG: hypothetical protein M1821_000869 [Bathelium mastoideum]|nr:MAG: hypothetical protein M1821_000869 [Bathelium mastoideum]KAI9694109.1 MAG: hypothetical protein M1822_003380 [Bathelium mastoideum]